MIPAMPGAAAVGFLLMLLAALAAVAFAARPAQAAAAHLAMGGGIAVHTAHLNAAGAGADCLKRSAAGAADGRAGAADAYHAGSPVVRGHITLSTRAAISSAICTENAAEPPTSRPNPARAGRNEQGPLSARETAGLADEKRLALTRSGSWRVLRARAHPGSAVWRPA